jgi:hypothetical protein
LYTTWHPDLTKISKDEFQSYKSNYKTVCDLDSGNFISGSDLYVIQNCKDICETYLAERSTNRKLLVPSSYDRGVLAMLLSPGCNQLIVCSSYDGPDFGKYYEDRAEIFVFQVNKENGLRGIIPSLQYYTKDWSIEDLTWVNDKTIALKIYKETRRGDGRTINYRYYKAKLHK